jgi:hypothetical protein
MTIAAITPPEGRREELFAASAARAESTGVDEITPVVLPEAGLLKAVLDVTAIGVRVEIGDDDDDDDNMISDEAEIGTGPETPNPSKIVCVAIEVEPPTTVLEVGLAPLPDACTSPTTAVGVLVLRSVGPPCS